MNTGTMVCRVEDLVPGSAKRVFVDGTPVAVVRDSDGAIHALGDTCTHGDISLSEGFVEGDEIECWAHGARFSLTTGKALCYPAFLPVPVFSVEVIDGAIYIGGRVT